MGAGNLQSEEGQAGTEGHISRCEGNNRAINTQKVKTLINGGER